MTTTLRRLLWNPILTLEVRSRMRSRRSVGLLTLYLVLIGGVAYLTYTSGGAQVVSVTGTTAAGPKLFQALGGAVVGLVVVLVPGICAPAISSERERQTLDLMLCTRMRASTIVIGKLLASLLFMLVLIVATVPILSMVFLLGGVDASSVLILLVIALATALVGGSIGLLCSALLRRSAAATLASYLVMGLLVSGPVVLTVVGASGRASPSVSCLNSICVPGVPPGPLTQVVTVASPLTAAAAMLDAYTPGRTVCDQDGGGSGGAPLIGPSGSFAPGGPAAAPNCRNLTRADGDVIVGGLFRNWHAWQAALLVDAVMVPLLLAGAVLLVRGRRPGLTLRHRRRRPAAPTEEAA